MPKFNKQSEEEIIQKSQETNTGLYVTAGDIEHSDFDDKDWKELQQDYWNMLNGEPIVSRCSKLLKTPILQAEYRIESGQTVESKECSDFIQYTLKNIQGGFQRLKYHKLLAIDLGLSMAEMIFKKADKFNGKLVNRLIKLNFFQNETIDRFNYNDNVKFDGVYHEKRTPEKASSFIWIKEGENGITDIRQKLNWFTFQEEFDDIRGKSLLRPLRLAWDSKIKVIQSMVRACQRGAGLPVIETNGKPSPSDEALIETIGNTLTHINNGYVAYDKNMMSIRLEELKGQKDNMALLEFLNRELFFGMMLEFSTSGIGGAGSRAATESHKSAYELQANYILQMLEENMQELIKVLVMNSPWAYLENEEIPRLKFNAITQVDTFRLAQTMKNMYDSMIFQKNPEDEKYFREIFGMPQSQIGTETISQEAKKLAKKEPRALSNYELNIFELSSAEDGYLNAQEESNKIIQDVFHKVLLEIAESVSKGAKSIRWSVKLEVELSERLRELYKELFTRGQADIEKEIAKHKKLSYRLASKKKDIVNNSIDRFTKKFFFNVKTQIDDKIEKIEDPKSLQQIIMGFEDGFKGDKRELLQTVEDGYTDGRGDALKEHSDEIEEYIYTGILDKNLCDDCAPYDNLTFTLEEIQAEGLNIGNGRVNPRCAGGDNCRCQLGIYSIKNL